MVDWCVYLIDYLGKFIVLKGVFLSEELDLLFKGIKFDEKISLEVFELDV